MQASLKFKIFEVLNSTLWVHVRLTIRISSLLRLCYIKQSDDGDLFKHTYRSNILVDYVLCCVGHNNSLAIFCIFSCHIQTFCIYILMTARRVTQEIIQE